MHMRGFHPLSVLILIVSSAPAWETPVNIGDVINTGYNEWYPDSHARKRLLGREHLPGLQKTGLVDFGSHSVDHV